MIPNPPRRLPSTAFFSFLLDRPRSFIIGVFIGIFPLLMNIPFIFIFSTLSQGDPDFKLISKNGKETNGIVFYKDIVSNITINGVNPIKIVYEYKAGGNILKDSFQTMSVMTVKNWKKGDKITIKYFDGDSIIPELEPVKFPFWIIFVFDLVFVIIGLPFLVFSISGALKQRTLYINGIERDAKIISMAPVGRLIFSFIKDRFLVNYSYKKSNGQESFGKSSTTDLTLINDKVKGDRIPILFDSSNEDRNCIVDDSIMIRCSQKV